MVKKRSPNKGKVVRYKSKKTGRFVSETTYKKLKSRGYFKKVFVDVRPKKIRKYLQLGLKTKKQREAFDKTLKKIEKSSSLRSKIDLTMQVDKDRGAFDGSHYQDLGARINFFLFGEETNGTILDFRAIFKKYQRLQNSGVVFKPKNRKKKKTARK